MGCKGKSKKTIFRDPVCNMRVSPRTAAASCEYDGKIYYFCAPCCLECFEGNPERYMDKWPRQMPNHLKSP